MTTLNTVGRTVVDDNGRLGRVISFNVTWADGQMQEIFYNLQIANGSQDEQYDEQMLHLLAAQNAAIAKTSADVEYFRRRYNHIVGKKQSSCLEKQEKRNAKLASALQDMTGSQEHLNHLLQEKKRIFHNVTVFRRSGNQVVGQD